MKNILVILLFVFISDETFCRDASKYTDSLKMALKHHIEDTSKVKLLIEITWALQDQGEFEKGLRYGKEGLRLSKKLNWLKGEAEACNRIAEIYRLQGNFLKALDFHYEALRKSEIIDNKMGMGKASKNIGVIHMHLEDFKKAKENNLKALKYFSEIKSEKGISDCLSNLGEIAVIENNIDSAKKYFLTSLELKIKINDERGIVAVKLNLGKIFLNQFSEIIDSTDPRKKRAFDYFKEALDLGLQINYRKGNADAYTQLGFYFMFENNLTQSKLMLDSGLIISKEINSPEYIRNSYQGLYLLSSQAGDYKNAFEYLLEYYKYRDLLINETNAKRTVQLQMQHTFDKKSELERIEQKRKEEIFEVEKRNQRLQVIGLSFGLIVVILIVIFVYRTLHLTRKQRNIIQKQKNETEIQKIMIETKNREILDSINYAKRLQQAILTPESEIKNYYKDSFLLYSPKDIVAGDFYFFEVTDTHVFYAAADCTGHGVPGAMVSIVCSNALTRCVYEFNLTDPGKILNKSRELILETFRKSSERVQDGMDISLLVCDKGKNVYSWAGANNPLWIISKGKVHTIDADKQPIGKSYEPKPFTTNFLSLKKEDLIILFTDGYSDQFGGEKGKKFKYSNLQKLLLENANLELEKLNLKLQTTFSSWKGDLEQVDDVCIIGIRI